MEERLHRSEGRRWMRCWMVCKINVSCSIDLTAGRRGLKMQTDQPRQTKWEGGHETFWNSLSRQHMLRHPGFFVNLPSSRRKEYWGSAAAQTHNSGPVQTQQVYYGNGEGEEAGGLRGVRVLLHEPSRTTCPSCCTNLAEKGKSSSEPQKVLVLFKVHPVSKTERLKCDASQSSQRSCSILYFFNLGPCLV